MDQLHYPEKGDFKVQNKYTFEVGDNTKNRNQIFDIENSYLAIDDIEYGSENRISLWLFGFLY